MGFIVGYCIAIIVLILTQSYIPETVPLETCWIILLLFIIWLTRTFNIFFIPCQKNDTKIQFYWCCPKVITRGMLISSNKLHRFSSLYTFHNIPCSLQFERVCWPRAQRLFKSNSWLFQISIASNLRLGFLIILRSMVNYSFNKIFKIIFIKIQMAIC